MQDYQREFIEFAVRVGALRFGSFTLKSGRQSPYFFNSGSFDDGRSLERLGSFYAQAARDLAPTVVFGPAYKGIPLAVATAIAFQTQFDRNVGYCFDRKETKTHGDAGVFVGRVPAAQDRVLLVDDVITDGATKLEAIERLRGASAAKLVGLVIALNRQERAADGRDPVAVLEALAGLPVRAVVGVRDVMEFLRGREIDGRVVMDEDIHARMQAYLSEYGVPV